MSRYIFQSIIYQNTENPKKNFEIQTRNGPGPELQTGIGPETEPEPNTRHRPKFGHGVGPNPWLKTLT